MKHSFTARFIRSYKDFSPEIQAKFDKQLAYLISDIKHPSLHTKKFDEATGIWQARVDRSIRFYFLIQEDVYVLLDIRRHTK